MELIQLLQFASALSPVSVKRLWHSAKRFLPPLVKPPLRLLDPWDTREEVQAYWRDPPKINAPQQYTAAVDRSIFVTDLVKRYLKADARILEIGCNVGRNLNQLHSSGFHGLEGIEINPKAAELMKKVYPEMGEAATIHIGPVEDIIGTIPDRNYDCVFTMAVLMHIHWDSNWTLAEIARITKDILITIEHETAEYSRGFARNYRREFERLGMRQLEETDCDGLEGLGRDYTARVLKVA